MSIHPITATRLKTFVLLGHSNADGWASSTAMFAANPDLAPVSLPLTFPEKAFWKNVYVYTSPQPWPGPRGTPQISDVGDGAWLEMNVAIASSPSGAHPHAQPYNFPNVRGACYPNWEYDASYIPGISTTGSTCGMEIPFSWYWQHHWGDQVGVIKMAFSATYLMRAETGGDPSAWLDPFGYSNLAVYTPGDPLRPESTVDPSLGYYGWWTPSDQFDWVPSTDRLYKKWYDKMVGAAADLPAGSKLDVRLIVIWMGDNDANNRSRSSLEQGYEAAARALFKRIRYDIEQNDWSTLPAAQIPIVLPSSYSKYANSLLLPAFNSVNFVNEVYAKIAKDDPYMRIVSSEGWNTLTKDGFGGMLIINPSTHFGPTGYIQAAQDVFEAYRAIEITPWDALDGEDLLTVTQIVDRVKTYYNRSRVNTDIEDDDLLLQHVNGAMTDVMNAVGDNAYWIRRREQMSLAFGPNAPVTLPRYVHRLLKIEDPLDPTYPMHFEQIGLVDGGKLQIIMRERSSGTYTVQFITYPREMTTLTEKVPIPYRLIEWLVVETCKRLARSSTNAALQASLDVEAMKLQKGCLHEMAVMQRSRPVRLRTQRRAINLNYRKRGLWGRDSSV